MRPALQPCPFCGSHRPAVRRRMLGYSDTLLAYGVGCLCGAHVLRDYERGRISVRDCRQQAIDAWNARTPVEAPTCPCCGSEELACGIGDWTAWAQVNAPVHFASCAACGLTTLGMPPPHLTMYTAPVWHIDGVTRWNVRVSPEKWIDPRAIEQADTKATDEWLLAGWQYDLHMEQLLYKCAMRAHPPKWNK